MLLLTSQERAFAEAVSDLAYGNPFTPGRVEAERRALGDAFVDEGPVWSLAAGAFDGAGGGGPNIAALQQRVTDWVERVRQRLIDGRAASDHDLALYEDLALYRIYEEQRDQLSAASAAALDGRKAPAPHAGWPGFLAAFNRLLQLPHLERRSDHFRGHDPAHLFACFFQIRRAFTYIFHYLVGSSMPAARLRAAVWQSIFTHDMRRYYRGLFTRMGDFTTLVTGDSGTGKELVARAIGRSRYVPFDAKTQRFADDFATSFYAVNLAALSPTLIESELFGHQRGAFTGAVAERKGWLEVCPPRGTVFLDEIGELDGAVQVKLLRVLQSRTFERIGDTTPRRFDGKIIAATNRDLAAELHNGRFRADLYYRLCSDVIHTPSLREQLADAPNRAADLRSMVRFITAQLVTQEADVLTDEIVTWIDAKLGRDYPWPGNFRELEQCVRNVIVRGEYQPLGPSTGRPDAAAALAADIAAGSLTADDLLTRYVALVHGRLGNYQATARRLGLDRRTVKARVEQCAALAT